MKRSKKILLRLLAALVLLYIVLLIPDANSDAGIIHANQKPFIWNKDAVWQSMEQQFAAAKKMPAAELDSIIAQLKSVAINKYAAIQNAAIAANDTTLPAIENNFFTLAAFVAAKPAETPWFTGYYNQVRDLIKRRSQEWNAKDTAVKNSLYTLLYGMRAAVEEVLLQSDSTNISPAMLVQKDTSVTPAAKIFGIEVHSGDLLVSRGGAEVSALISRGNDYPGNFSHIALVYIDDKTNQAYLIEAHIEKGVAVSSIAQYEQDKKLRFMVLRLNSGLPAMQQNPQLPQQAAAAMYTEALSRHIPYDFKMNFYDSAAMFCSEVASYAYRKKGIQLWQNSSTISQQGIVNWLHNFGVENFVTQMPSDLEYDPQLCIVAEWRDPATLYKDHIDNAAMDALLEQANAGRKINYNTWMLPIARVLKAYSWVKNRFGASAMVPEGMSATQALKNQTFVAMHVAVKNRTLQLAAAFEKQQGYRAPYWQLVQFARAAAAE